MKKIVGIILIALGAVLLVVTGIRALTLQSKSVFEVSVPSSGTFVYTAPGVLGMGGSQVTVTFAGDGIVQWGFGNEDDVVAYVGDSAAAVLTGVVSPTEAEVKNDAAAPEAAAADAQQVAAGGFNLSHSDLWLQSGEGEGKAVAKLTLEPNVPRAIVATTSTGVAPEMTVRWDNVPVAKPIPLLAFSLLILLFGLLLLVQEIQDGINAPAPAEPVEKRDRSADLTEVILPFWKLAKNKKAETSDSAGTADAAAAADSGETDTASKTESVAKVESEDEAATPAAGAVSAADTPPETPPISSGSSWRALWEFTQQPVTKAGADSQSAPETAAAAAETTDHTAEDEDA